MGKIFCILGRSATGKSTVEKHLTDMGYTRIISNTTRQPRKGEIDGVDYNYITEKQFEAMKQNNELYEYTEYNNWKYSISKSNVSNLDTQNYICVIEVHGFKQLQDNLGKDKVVPILLYTDSYSRLKRAIEREPHAEDKVYREICRRFLSDYELFDDFEKTCKYKINNTYYNKTYTKSKLLCKFFNILGIFKKSFSYGYETAKIIDNIIKSESRSYSE